MTHAYPGERATFNCHGTEYRVFGRDFAEIWPGDTVTDFRGQDHAIRAVTRGPEHNGTAKVQTDRGEYYAQVFGLSVMRA